MTLRNAHRLHRAGLRREELPAGTFGDLERQEVRLAKTADRSVLGTPDARIRIPLLIHFASP